jgi:xylulokinase
MDGYVVGCDVGSQSIKGVLVDPDGALVASAASPYAMQHPASGWAEQQPQVWMDGVAYVVGSLLNTSGVSGSAITGLGFASQVDGLVAVDDAMVPLRPAIIWLDRRAAREAEHLRSALSADRMRQLTGLNIDASHTAAKIMWLRDHEPERYRKVAALLSPGSYVVAALTGELVSDHANASSTMVYDVGRREWSQDLLDVTGIEQRLLPRLDEAQAVAGPLTADAAAWLGLSASCTVVVGTGDEHGACLGAGVVGPGAICDITGTAEPVAAAAPEPMVDATGLVETHAHAAPRTWLIENPGFVSGGSTLWYAESVLGIAQRDLPALAEQAPAGSDGVVFLPALSGSMAPRWSDHARGVFSGLAMNHTRSHLARAVYEGTTFALRDIVDRMAQLGLEGDEVRVVGGGSASSFWMQLKADVTGRVVHGLRTPEPTAVGAAMLAGVGTGLFDDLAVAIDRLTVLDERAYEPSSATAAAYDDAYHHYRSLFDAVEPMFAQRAAG